MNINVIWGHVGLGHTRRLAVVMTAAFAYGLLLCQTEASDDLVSEVAAKIAASVQKGGKKYNDDLKDLKQDLTDALKRELPNLKEGGPTFKEIVAQALKPAIKPLAEQETTKDVDKATDEKLYARLLKERIAKMLNEQGLPPTEVGSNGKPADTDKTPDDSEIEALKKKIGITQYDTDWFLVQSGLILLDPFPITQTAPGVFALDPSKAEARGFVEALVRSRFAWRHDVLASNTKEEGKKTWSWWQSTENGAHCSKFPVDFELKGGFTFAGSSQDASTIVGGGDGYATASVGFPLKRGWLHKESEATLPLFSFNFPETEVSFVSSRTAGDVHTHWGLGVGTVWGIPMSKESTRKAEVLGMLGYAQVDHPLLVPGTTTLVVNAAGLPEYDRVDAVLFKVEARVPFGESGFLSLGGRYYSSTGDPDPWSMFLGYTLSIDALAKMIRQ